MEERDHKKLGPELELFYIDPMVGKGLPMFLPKGATIKRELERFVIEEEIKRGYLHVHTPNLARLELYEKSGHYPHYQDSMYAPIEIDEERYMLRPMTCPHHFQLYLQKPHSYRELPMRIAELAQLYRYEQSGELMGLQRVRTFCLADAHIICATEEQAADEVGGALDLIEYMIGVFGLKLGLDYRYRLSLGDRTNTEKYYKNDDAWEKSEALLRKVMQKRGCDFEEAKNEAAFYGPKIDVQVWSAIGKEFTLATNQVDFAVPKRFDLTFTNKEGKAETPLCIHRAPLGTHERFIGFLIEHYAGIFPLWLSPVQVKVIPVRTNHNEYAKQIFELLKENNIRAELDDSDENLGTKVRDAKNKKMPYWIVIGDKEIEAKKVTLESRLPAQAGDAGQLGQISKEELVAKLVAEVKIKI